MMSISKSFRCFVGAAILFSLGCETPPSRVTENFGKAYESNNSAMLANPDAGQDPADGVTLFEGVTVENALRQYRREQVKPVSKSLPSSILEQAVSGSSK